jgi:mono/diheme cytochrome c family protein
MSAKALAVVMAVAAGLLAGTDAQAQRRGSASEGMTVAQRYCASCHLIGGAQQSVAQPGVPSFAAIAKHAGQTPERLAGIIIIPHPPMPNLSLTMREVQDVVAYIMSLKDAQ